MTATAILWFRRDLRLEDNPAQAAALESGARLVCVYIHAPDEEAPWVPGAASRWWLHHSLAALAAALAKRGARLHIFRGESRTVLQNLARQTDAAAVYWNRLYEPAVIERDAAIKQSLRSLGTAAHSFNASLLTEPWAIETGDGNPYRVFTPYWRKARSQLQPQPPISAPRRIDSVEADGAQDLDSLGLLSRIGWDAEFPGHWQPGERGAQVLLRRFGERTVGAYAQERNRPAHDGTSRLSPHLHFGEIGPRQIFWALSEAARDAPAAGSAAEAYVRELGWRDFSHSLLYHFPQTAGKNLNPQFNAFAWAAEDRHALGRWERGMTGVPIVDAGMRQLWKSGWMHNRVRMIVASYLTKNLRQHWLHGARWFWDTLLDADLANNTQGWQWTAGCGADAAPYFRIFNPVSQGERFDPDGAYVRRWVPELKRVAAPLIHQPWCDPGLLQKTGYPAPLVDLRTSREAALAAYRQMRGES